MYFSISSTTQLQGLWLLQYLHYCTLVIAHSARATFLFNLLFEFTFIVTVVGITNVVIASNFEVSGWYCTLPCSLICGPALG